MRRKLRSLLTGVSGKYFWRRNPSHEYYTPVLSEHEFLTYLERRSDLGSITWEPGDTNGVSEASYQVTYALRDIIGQRFFLHPNDIKTAIQEIEQRIPGWKDELDKFVGICLRSGLPIYSSVGPSFNDHCFWGNLRPGLGDDALFPYRPHRFAFLPRLAMAVHEGLLPSSLFRRIVDEWVNAAKRGNNPYCYGSNLIVIQRILAVSWAWSFLAARSPARTPDGLGLEGTLLRILWADAQFLSTRLGDSVPNNHLLADRFIGFFLHSVLPEFIDGDRDEVEVQFRNELLRQTYQDGGSFEHSIHYHEFVCEMGVAYLLMCRSTDHSPDQELARRIEKLLLFQIRLTGPYAVPLPVGNATEDPLFPLDSEDSWCAGSLREIYRALFDHGYTPAPVADRTRERAFWMLGGNLESRKKSGECDWIPTSMTDAGFHVFPERQTGCRLIFRTGPSENVSVAAGHMHADLMSIYFTRGDRPVLIDAGTFTYRFTKKTLGRKPTAWRAYFAGPAAHNTFSISGEDPLGTIEQDFRPFKTLARVRSSSEFVEELAWTEACTQDAGPYSGHVRGCIHLRDHYWIIYDSIPAVLGTPQQRWLGFQLAPDVQPCMDNRRFFLRFPDSDDCTTLVSTTVDQPLLLEGSLDPIGGWISRRYGKLEPAPQLRFPVPPTQHISAFVITDSKSAPESVDIEPVGPGLEGIRIETVVGQDWMIINNPLRGKATQDPGDLIFDGAVLWLRFEKGNLIAVRSIHGSKVKWPSKGLDLQLNGP